MLIELLTKKYPGMRLWLSQRLTALFMATYIVLSGLYFAVLQPADYQTWVSAVSPWWWRVLTWVFFLNLCIHAWLGVTDVLKDYVFNQATRAYLQVGVDVLLLAYLGWTSYILWNI
ncbi:MAG: succinate dehydrogenase, hydrophobic membrane anchor protein [Methylophilaceae bacterium]